MTCASNRGPGRGRRLADRYERAMLRFAKLVEASFAWWDNVPPVWQAVALLHVGLLPAVTEVTRLTNLLG